MVFTHLLKNTLSIYLYLTMKGWLSNYVGEGLVPPSLSRQIAKKSRNSDEYSSPIGNCGIVSSVINYLSSANYGVSDALWQLIEP